MAKFPSLYDHFMTLQVFYESGHPEKNKIWKRNRQKSSVIAKIYIYKKLTKQNK